MQVTNNAEGGTNATTVTTANSGGTSGTAFNTVNSSFATVVFDNTQTAGGTFSIRTAIADTSAAASFGWTTTALGSPTRVFGRVYFRLPSPVVSREIIRWRRATTQIARLRVDGATGFLEFRQGNNSAPTTSGGTGTVALSGNTWYRVEWDVQAGTVSNTINLYLGDSTTPLETIVGNGVFGTSGAVNEVMFGQFTSVTNLGDTFFDDLVVNDTGLPGPARTSQSLTRGIAEALTQGDALGRGLSLPRVGDGNTVTLTDGSSRVGVRPRGVGETMTLGDAGATVRALGVGSANSVQVADSWVRQVAKLTAIAESLGLGDSVVRGAVASGRSQSELVSLGHVVDRVATSYGRGQGESLVLGHAVSTSGARSRGVAEVVSVADSPSALVVRGRGSADSMPLLDVATRLVARGRVPVEALGAGDSPARQVSRSTVTAELVGVLDSVSRIRSANVGSVNSLTVSDAWGCTFLKAVGSGNTIAVVDAAGRGLAFARALPDGLAFGHVVATGRGVMLASGESLSVADIFARSSNRSRSWSEFLAVDSSVATGVSYVLGVGEGLGSAEVFQVGRVVLVGIAETIDVDDVTARAVGGGAVGGESLAFGDVAGRIVVRGRGLSEVLAAVDAVGAGQSVTAGVAQALVLGHTVSRSATVYGRSAPQTMVLVDAVSRAGLAYVRGAPQSLVLVDALQAGKVMLLGAAETVTTFDVGAAIRSVGRAGAETVLLGHAVVRSAMARSRGMGDVFGLSVAAQTGRIIAPSFSEAMPLADSWVRAQSGSRGVAEAVVLGHVVVRGVSRVRAGGEAMNVVDALLAQREIIPVAFAGEVAFSESIVAKVARSRGSGGNAVVLAEVADRLIDRGRSVPEALIVADLVRAVRGQSVAADAQPMTLDDIARAATARRIAVAETVLLFSAAAAGDSSGNPIVIAHAGRVRMTREPYGRVRMTKPPSGGVRMTEGG